jgi:hypothetical protein
MIKDGNSNWKTMVPEEVAGLIDERNLFMKKHDPAAKQPRGATIR